GSQVERRSFARDITLPDELRRARARDRAAAGLVAGRRNRTSPLRPRCLTAPSSFASTDETRARRRRKQTEVEVESSVLNKRGQAIEKLDLRLVDLLLRQFDWKKFRPVYLGELVGPSRARRPFQGKRVRGEHETSGQVALKRPGMHRLSALLFHRA